MRVPRRLAGERASTLVELLLVVGLLCVVLASLGGLLLRGSRAQADVNRRFQAQQGARVALDRLRRDVHCASAATVAPAQLALTLPAGCASGTGAVTWCVLGAAAPYALYRRAAATCDATGVRWSAQLASNVVFGAVTGTGLLPRVHVDLRLQLAGGGDAGRYALVDDLVLRNGVRP